MYYSQIRRMDVSDGPGIRVSLYVSGCRFHCKECFNPETWDFEHGKPYTEGTKNRILSLVSGSHVRGLSLLGGDPLWQDEDGLKQLIELVEEVKALGKDVWIWSGFVYEQIMTDNPATEIDKLRKELVSKCDVWVDGLFEIEKKDLRLPYCGSTNQRVIDMKDSILCGTLKIL